MKARYNGGDALSIDDPYLANVMNNDELRAQCIFLLCAFRKRFSFPLQFFITNRYEVRVLFSILEHLQCPNIIFDNDKSIKTWII